MALRLARRAAAALVATTICAAAVPTHADTSQSGGAPSLLDATLAGLFGRDTLHGVLDLRLAAADGEPSFTETHGDDAGFDKARYGGHGGTGFIGRADVALAGLEWRPKLTWDLSAVVDVIAQPRQEHAVDLDQAFLVYKPAPRSATSVSARAGLYYPQISLEHDGPDWTTTDTITPSAIDSWIGEEVKVVGAEVSVARRLGDQTVLGTLGVFGNDDTSGTLLAYRGWSLSDYQGQANGSFELPARSPFATRVQADETYTSLELDHRPGTYGRIEWRPSPTLSAHAFYYDNLGDMTAMSDHQWSWATRFGETGVSWDATADTRVLAQALSGKTIMGRPTSGGRFVDMDFHAAYLLVGHRLGGQTLTGRVDAFDTHDNAAPFLEDTNEHGWALTGAVRRPLGRHADVRLEILHVESDRPSRAYEQEAAFQRQTVLQSSLRFFY